MDCVFCTIDKEKTRTVEVGKTMTVILSNPRLMKGHILIIPKRNIEKINDLTSAEKDEMFSLLCKYNEKILKNFASGVDIKQNYRPFMKNSEVKVAHFHFHLQPRELFDELYEKSQKHETEIFKKLTEEEINETLKKLK